MASTVFSTSTGVIELPSTGDPVLVSIVSRASGGGSSTHCSNMPLISIDDLTTTDRVQVDCSLDGVFHVLKASGGFGSCTLTFLDAMRGCGGGALSFKSALREYVRMRRNDKGRLMDVTIKLHDGKVTFNGYLLSCKASLRKIEGDIAIMTVSYTLIGDLDT